MGEGSSGLVAKDVDQLLEPDLDGFGGIVIVGKIRAGPPEVLRPSVESQLKVRAFATHEYLAELLVEAMHTFRGVLRVVFPGVRRGKRGAS